MYIFLEFDLTHIEHLYIPGDVLNTTVKNLNKIWSPAYYQGIISVVVGQYSKYIFKRTAEF